MKKHICRNNRQTSFFGETGKNARAHGVISDQRNAGNIFTLAMSIFCLFFVASCGLVTRNFTSSSSSSNSNTEANTNTSNSNGASSYDKEKFQKLLDAGAEIEKMSLPVKIDPKPTLKGKVFVFSNVAAKAKNDYSYSIAGARKAESLDELQTAIRVNCKQGKFLGDFHGSNTNGVTSKAKGYGIECDVALIDYPGRVIFDQKSFSNSDNQDVISSKEITAEVYLNPPPFGDIMRYINSLPVDKVIPGMTLLDEKELIRLPTTVGLKPDASLKGKIKFARLYEETDISQLPAKIDGYLENTFPPSKSTFNPAELETLVKIICGKGDKIGLTGKTPQYANRCEISLVDYKTLTVISQKIIENKTLDDNPTAKDAGAKIWVTKLPKEEIESYLKSLPTS